MPYSYVQYTGNGSQKAFTFSFSYLDSSNIKVSINSVDALLYDLTNYLGEKTSDPTTNNSGGTLVAGALYYNMGSSSMRVYSGSIWSPLDSQYVYSLTSTNMVEISPAPISGALVNIRRNTDIVNPVVNFTDGSVLQEKDLDLLAQFSLYTAQESKDEAKAADNAGASAYAASLSEDAAAASAAAAEASANSVNTTVDDALAAATVINTDALATAETITDDATATATAITTAAQTAVTASADSAAASAATATTKATAASTSADAAAASAVAAASSATTSASNAASTAADKAAVIALTAENVAIGSNASVGIIASDLGGMGFAYDLGSVAEAGSGVSSSGAGNIVTVANNISSVNTVAANISSIGAASTSATAAASSATAAATSATNALAAKVAAESARDSSVTLATSFNASATSLSAGSLATASFNPTTYKLTLGIPAGATGATGATGAAGAAGTNGTNGTNGAAATIAVGTVTTGAAGSSATVTNAGSSSAAVFNFSIPKGADGTGSGTVTSVAMTTPTGLSVTGSPITSSGTLAIALASGYSIPTNASQTNWDTAFTDRNKWDGGATGLVAATGRTSLGLGTIATLAAPSGTVVGTSDTQTLTNKTITGLKETRSAIAASAIDMSAGNYFTKTISGATTFTISNTAATGSVNSFILDLTNGGSSTVTWWSGVKWAAATAPTLTASGRDVLGFFTQDGGTTWNGFVLGKAMA